MSSPSGTSDTGDRAHYQGRIECADAIAVAIQDLQGEEAWLVGQCLKYLWRFRKKGQPAEDLLKCRWYLNRLIATVEAKDGEEADLHGRGAEPAA